MREIRIKNLKAETLIHIVIAFKSNNFLVKKDVYESLLRHNSCEGAKVNFITSYGDVFIETVIEFKKYGNKYYKICNVAVNKNLVYGSSPFWEPISEVIIIGTE